MDFPAGSMGPKGAAVCRFVELTGDLGAIGRLEDAPAILRGETGTIVTPSGDYQGVREHANDPSSDRHHATDITTGPTHERSPS
jgi:hypothetical protein